MKDSFLAFETQFSISTNARSPPSTWQLAEFTGLTWSGKQTNLPRAKKRSDYVVGERLSALRSRRVLVANCGDDAHLPHAAKRMCGNVGTTRVVTEVFRQ